MAHSSEPDKAASAAPRGLVPFDPFLTSGHPLVAALADNLATAFEESREGRQREMKKPDKRRTRAMLLAVLANLIRAAAEGVKPPAISVSLRAARLRQTRYDPPGFSGLPKLLETLAETAQGFTLQKSARKGQPSVLSVGGWLQETFARFAFKADDFAQEPGREIIWLCGANGPQDYAETDETRHLRTRLETLNKSLRRADLTFLPDGGPVVLTPMRELHRSFVGSFAGGGNLAGGWWQDLEPSRRKSIRIDGEPVELVAFNRLPIRLAHLVAGAMPPDGELPTAPGFAGPNHRQGIERTILAMLAAASPLTRLPKDAKSLLPDRVTVATVRAAILTAYPQLVPVLECGIKPRIDFMASQIVVAALLHMAGKRCVALPVDGDGVLCPKSKVVHATRALRAASRKTASIALRIDRGAK